MVKRKPVRSEHSAQVRLVMHVRTFYPDVLIVAVPNGAAVSGLHRIRLVAEGLLSGFPDLMILEPRRAFHGLFVEMKSEVKTAVTSEVQKLVHKQLLLKGYQVRVCKGYAEAKDMVLQYLRLSGWE